MLTAVVTAAFKNIDEALHIRIDIGVRMRDRMPDTCLRREMNDMLEFALAKQSSRRLAIRKIEFDELEMIGR